MESFIKVLPTTEVALCVTHCSLAELGYLEHECKGDFILSTCRWELPSCSTLSPTPVSSPPSSFISPPVLTVWQNLASVPHCCYLSYFPGFLDSSVAFTTDPLQLLSL